MPQCRNLPAGLDPITAGRFALWMLGKRSHRRAQRRTVSASRVWGGGLAQRFVTLVAPWTVEEYPGRLRLLAGLCGVTAATSKDWLYRDKRLPAKHAHRLHSIAIERAEQWYALAADLARHAGEQERIAKRPRGIVAQQLGQKTRFL
jgi:hypothetical protein